MLYILMILITFLCASYFDWNRNKVNSKSRIGKIKNLWLTIILIICIFLGGLRNIYIGDDTINYFWAWKGIPTIEFLNQNYLNNSRYQPLFNIFLSISKSITSEFFIATLIHCTFINLIIFWFIKKENYKYAFSSIIFYLIINYIEFNMEIMRESISVCFGLISYYYYKKNEYVIAILLTLLALGFHLSAIILFIFPLLDKIRYSRRTIVIFLLIGTSILFIFPFINGYLNELQLIVSQDSEMSALLNNYNNDEIEKSLNINYFILLFTKNLLFPLIGILLLKESCNRYIGFVLAYCIFMLISSYTVAFYRFGNYLSIFYAIFLSRYCISLANRYFKKSFLKPIAIASFICFTLYCHQGYQLKKTPDGSAYLYERYYPYKISDEL